MTRIAPESPTRRRSIRAAHSGVWITEEVLRDGQWNALVSESVVLRTREEVFDFVGPGRTRLAVLAAWCEVLGLRQRAARHRQWIEGEMVRA